MQKNPGHEEMNFRQKTVVNKHSCNLPILSKAPFCSNACYFLSYFLPILFMIPSALYALEVCHLKQLTSALSLLLLFLIHPRHHFMYDKKCHADRQCRISLMHMLPSQLRVMPLILQQPYSCINIIQSYIDRISLL